MLSHSKLTWFVLEYQGKPMFNISKVTLFKLIALNKCLKIVVIQIQWHFTYQLTFQCSLIDIVRIFRSEYWERYLYPLCRRKDSKWGEIPTHTPTPRMWKLLPVSEIQLKKSLSWWRRKVAWPDLSAGGGCLSPNLGLSPLPLALGPATGSSTTASTLPPGRLSGRTRGAENLKSQANQKI